MSKNSLFKAIGIFSKTPVAVSISKSSTVLYPPTIGIQGELKSLDVNEILFDPSYQRPCHRSHAVAIAKAWDWSLLKTISVAQRSDGTYWAYDGQHQIIAARLRGDISTLPCYVVQSDGVKSEAASFLKINTKRIRINVSETHVAGIIAEDVVALKIDEAFKKFGIELASSSHTPKAKTTTSVGVIRQQFARLSNVADAELRLNTVLAVLHAAWPEDDRTYSGTVVRAMWRFVASVSNQKLLLDECATRLGRYTLHDTILKGETIAKATGKHLSTTVLPAVLLDQFNHKSSIKLA